MSEQNERFVMNYYVSGFAFLTTFCILTGCIGQDLSPRVLPNARVTDDGTNLIISWDQPHDTTFSGFSSLFYLYYYQAFYDHSGRSPYISASSLAPSGGVYQYRLSKSAILGSYKYLGPLLIYIEGTDGTNEWYSQSVLYNPSSSEQSSSSFQLIIELPSDVDCEYFLRTWSVSTVTTELKSSLQPNISSFQQAGELEVSLGCVGDSILLRGTFLVYQGNADDYRDVLKSWLNEGNRYILLRGDRYYVSVPPCGLERSGVDGMDCASTLTAMSSTSGTGSATATVDVSLVIGSIALGLGVVLLAVFLTSGVCICLQRKKAGSPVKRHKANVYQVRPLPAVENDDFSLTRNPSYGEAPLIGQEPLKASIPPVKENNEMYM